SMFGQDAVNTAVPYFALPDRAAAIERSWEIAFAQHTGTEIADLQFPALWPNNAEHPWPALLLNGTVVETGGRIVVSNLLLKDASCSFFIDALSVTGTRMRVSTAANMSARFTYVEPAGQIVNANVSDPCVHDLQVVDGGYFENFGATTAREVTEQA